MTDEGEDYVAGGESNYSDRAKRARIEYRVGSSGGHDAVDTDRVKTINIPNERIGVITGEGGETIKNFQLQSGAKIHISSDAHAEPNSTSRAVFLTGTLDHIAKAEKLINDVLTEAGASGSGIVPRRLTGQQSGADHFIMIPNNKVGLLVGKEGETIKSMQTMTGARNQVISLHPPPPPPLSPCDMSNERTVRIDGTSIQIEAAKQLVENVIREIPLFPRPLVNEVSSKSVVGFRSRAESKTSRGVSQNILTRVIMMSEEDHLTNDEFLSATSFIENLVPNSPWIDALLHSELARELKAK